MSIKLDLSQFKHIKSDKDSSTLQHKQGHILTIAHKPLAKDSREALMALSKLSTQDQTPIEQDEAKHQSGQKMADGGDIQSSQQPVDRTSRVAGGTVKGASGADITDPKSWWAEGGKVAKYCQYCGGSAHVGGCTTNENKTSSKMAEGGNVADKPQPSQQEKPQGQTLNYPAMKKEYLEKNKPKYGEHNKPKFAEGAHEIHGNYDINPQQEQASGEDAQIAAGQAAQNYQDQLRADRGLPPMDAQPQQQQAAQPGTYVMAGDQPAPPQPQAMDPNSPAQASDTPQQAPQAGAQPPTVAPVQQQPMTLQDHAMKAHVDLANEAQTMQQDINAGHISPKTYSDLFHFNQDGSEKSTLGKISTAFGMLLAGAGSGLAHQPNAMLNMMDKYIENDLNAQEKSTANRQNFLKINQQDMLNKAQVPLTQEQTQAAHLDNKMKAYVQSQIAAQDMLTKQVDQMPDGPKKTQAMQALYMMNQGIQSGAGTFASKLIAAKASADTLVGLDKGQAGIPGINPEAALHHQNAMLRAGGNAAIADANEAHHLAGYSQPAGQPIPQAARDQILAHDKMEQSAAQLKNFVSTHGGAWDRMLPANRAIAAQMVLPIQAGFREGTLGTVYREGEQPLLDKAIHGQPLSLAQYFLQTEPKKLDQLRKTNQEQKNLTVKNLGIDPDSAYSNMQQQQSRQPQEGQSMMSKSGRPITYSNGQWNYK